jgi:serine/threonine-protein kinase RsbW/stage II sporulation protein AB (anti-sigma F factor)
MRSPLRSAGSLDLELPAVPSSVATGRHAVAEFCAGLAVDHEAVALAVSEAVTNAVVHAYRDDAHGPVRISASLAGSALLVVVNDNGQGMTPGTDSGVGLALIARLSSTVEIDGDGAGTRLAMHFAPTP